jgi:hypothetical protein
VFVILGSTNGSKKTIPAFCVSMFGVSSSGAVCPENGKNMKIIAMRDNDLFIDIPKKKHYQSLVPYRSSGINFIFLPSKMANRVHHNRKVK